MGKKKLKRLNKQIEESKRLLQIAKKKMIDSGFSFDDIRAYNTELSKLGDLQTKVKHEEKHIKPRQFMDEISIQGIKIT